MIGYIDLGYMGQICTLGCDMYKPPLLGKSV